MISKIELDFDSEYFHSILEFCIKGENILMKGLMNLLVDLIFAEVDIYID